MEVEQSRTYTLFTILMFNTSARVRYRIVEQRYYDESDENGVVTTLL